MTEYITKEQAEKIARKCGLASDDETIYGRIQMMAIELAFEQRLEVVGYQYEAQQLDLSWRKMLRFTEPKLDLMLEKHRGEFKNIQPIYTLKEPS